MSESTSKHPVIDPITLRCENNSQNRIGGREKNNRFLYPAASCYGLWFIITIPRGTGQRQSFSLMDCFLLLTWFSQNTQCLAATKQEIYHLNTKQAKKTRTDTSNWVCPSGLERLLCIHTRTWAAFEFEVTVSTMQLDRNVLCRYCNNSTWINFFIFYLTATVNQLID